MVLGSDVGVAAHLGHGLVSAPVAVFELEGLSQFDPKYVMTFLEHITQSYLGNQVRLNDGTIGTIIYINKLAYSRPMIQAGNEYIDLSRTSGKHIVGIL